MDLILPTLAHKQVKRFHPVVVVAVILGLSFLLSRWAVWYGNEVSIPRYCAEPESALASLRAVVDDTVAIDGAIDGIFNNTVTADRATRRSAMVAAKLMFLLPRESGESVDTYITRVRWQLQFRCQ